MFKTYRRGTTAAGGVSPRKEPFEVDITMYRNWVSPKEQLKIKARIQ